MKINNKDLYGTLYTKRSGRRNWELTRSWSTPYVTVPRGFATDGASVPRPLWAVASPAGRMFEAAVIHDFLVSSPVEGLNPHRVFYRAMRDYDVNIVSASLAYVTVSIYSKVKNALGDIWYLMTSRPLP